MTSVLFIFGLFSVAYMWNCVRNLREDAAEVQYGYVQPMELLDGVLQYNPEAFQCSTPGKPSI